MTIEAYVAALRRAARALPAEEVDAAAAYYEAYLREADDPDQAMAALGTPKAVAAALVVDYVGKKTTRPGVRVLWAVIGGVFALPIALPVAVAGFAIALSLVIATFAVVGSLLISGVAVALAGVAGLVTGGLIVTQSLTTSLWLIGGSLVCLGLGALGTVGMVRLGRLIVAALARLIARVTRRRAR